MNVIKKIMWSEFYNNLEDKINKYSENKSTEGNIDINIVNYLHQQFTVKISEKDLHSPLYTYIFKIIAKDIEVQNIMISLQDYLSLYGFSLNNQFNLTVNHVLQLENFKKSDYLKIKSIDGENKFVRDRYEIYFCDFLTELEMKMILGEMKKYDMKIYSSIGELVGDELIYTVRFYLYKFENHNFD